MNGAGFMPRKKNIGEKTSVSAIQTSRWALLLLVFAIGLASVQEVHAQAQDSGKAGQSFTPGPVPPQISSAKKIFIANDVPDAPPPGMSGYSGGPSRPYDQFYTAVKNWGHYEITATPNDADLVLEIHLIIGHKVADQLRLNVRDPKSNVLLWSLDQKINAAVLAGSREKNFNQAMQKLMAQLTQLAGAEESSGAKK